MASDDMNECLKNVVIVGGGLAGLMVALQLRKHGIDTHIYEKSKNSTEEGTMIAIASNGSRVLPQELIPKLKESGLANFAYAVADKQGNIVTRPSPPGDRAQKYPRILIPWKNAVKIFSEATLPKTLHYGYECHGITAMEDGGGVIVHFKHGNEKVDVKASLVIGADGIRSEVRRSLFGSVPLRDTGCTIWRAMVDASLCSDKMPLNEACILTYGEKRLAFITSGSDGKLFWALIAKDEVTGYDDKSRSNDMLVVKENILKFFEGWELVTNLVEATNPSLILERRLTDMDVLPKWYKEQVVLIGDAAHVIMPNVGQGANLSFEDGHELAFQLATCSNLKMALEKFEGTRIPRTCKVQEYSRALLDRQFSPSGDMVPSRDFLEWLHNYDPHKVIS